MTGPAQHHCQAPTEPAHVRMVARFFAGLYRCECGDVWRLVTVGRGRGRRWRWRQQSRIDAGESTEGVVAR